MDPSRRRYWTGSEWGEREQPPKDYRTQATRTPTAPQSWQQPGPGKTPPPTATTSTRWLFIGLGLLAAIVIVSLFVASNKSGNRPPAQPIPAQVDSPTNGLAEAQARWDASDYMQQQATCASWRSYSHDEFFSLNSVPIEERPLITTLLNRNC